MPDEPLLPIEYRGARPAAAAEAAATPVPAVPVEFDTVLTTSADHAAVGAIETALRAAKVPTFRTDDGELAGRTFTLLVKAADAEKAAAVATRIFARRQRVKTVIPAAPPTPDGPAKPRSWLRL